MARGFSYANGASPEVDEAAKPFLHRATLAMHAQSKNALVRETIAARDDVPFGLMVTLAHDPTEDVRARVAANPRATRAVLDHLAGDRSLAVLIALVSNPALPAELLESLVFHKRPDVRAAAATRLDDRGPELVPALEDTATPELRDVAAAAPVLAVAPPTLAPLEETSARRPTRTAPIRGFRIPVEQSP